MTGSLTLTNNGGFFFSSPFHSSIYRSSTVFKSGMQRSQYASLTNLITQRSTGLKFQVLVNPNVSPGKRNSNNEIIMVDPLEAKRLAAKQMQEIQAKEKLKRRRQIEAINGAWAMIGLTAGLVIEGHTGNSILTQLAGYLSAVINLFA